MKIIGGIIAYEDGVKTVGGDQFSPTRKVRVELNFSIEDGEDAEATIDKVLTKASAFVHQKLVGSKAASGAATAAAPATSPVAAATPPAAGGKTKADLEAEKVAAATPRKPGRPPKIVSPEPVKAADPASMEDVTIVQPEPMKPAADPASMEDLTTVQPAEVTDKDLNDAVQKKNAVLKNPVAIRGVVAQFNPDPTKQFTLAQIPQGQRREFLSRLDALK